MSPIGNPNLRLPHAVHVSAGVEHKVSDTFTASVEGFAKWMRIRITTTTPGGRARSSSTANAVACSVVSFSLRVRPEGPFSGFLSYTLMRSERADDGEPYRLFNRDQTHIFNASGAYRLGRGWELGATVRYSSGTPYTPVVGSTFDAANDVYLPRLGRPDERAQPGVHSHRCASAKDWTFSRWSLAVYLDLQNMLNAENREGFTYSYDYRRREAIRGLPILARFGNSR